MNEISLKKFIAHFGDDKRREKRFCFILGAGASKSSGIPTGGELVERWVKEMKEQDEEFFEQWLKEKKIPEDDYHSHYSEIFEKRFELSKKDGFAFLERIMEGAEPSCGYSVLAQILAQNNHNIVITTNFDSLTEDALFIYTQKKPLVVGHAALAGYISTTLSRPLVIKIHHDLLLSPKNASEEVNKLDNNFSKNLKDIFKYYTPLVVGYGGNDGSLMDFLKGLDHIEEGIFWFYKSGQVPKQGIIDLVDKVNGHFVPINGFDELMIQLGNALKLEPLDNRMKEISDKRIADYRDQVQRINKTLDKETKKALSGITQRGERNWWHVEMEAELEKDPEKKNNIYQKGIVEFHESFELLNNYANFLYNICKDYDAAEQYYKKALELDPDNATTNGNYANFLCDIHKDYDAAEQYYKKALELDPDNAVTNGNYANFLYNICKDYDAAEQYYKKALELDPDNALTNSNYAQLLIVLDRCDEALNFTNKAFMFQGEIENDLTLELWFYCYAVFPDKFPNAKLKIEKLLSKEIRPIAWDFSEILKVAKKQKHPDYKYLVEVDKRITKL